MTDTTRIAIETIDESTDPTEQMAAAFSLLVDKLTELNQSADVTNQYLGAMGESVEKAKEPVQETTFSLSDLNQGLEVVNKALGYAQKAYDATIAKTTEYAEEVRNLKAVSGQSAENTSRFIQVLDDYQISAQDAMGATKALTKQGLAPTTDTLADLSEKYLSLNTVQERNEFVTKNLGKAGLEWVNILKQGPEAIRAQAAAVNSALILNEKTLAQAEQLRLAQDQYNDTLSGLSITAGTELIPRFTAWLAVIDKVANNTGNARNAVLNFLNPVRALIDLTQLYGDTYNELSAKAQDAANAQTEVNEAIEPTPEELQAAAQAAQELSAAYASILSNTQSIQGFYDTLGSSVRNLRDEQSELERQISETPAWETDKIAGYQAKLDEIPGKIQEVQQKYSESMAKIAYDNYLAKLSVDGLTDAEFEQAQQAGVALGIFTQSSADQAIALNNLTTALANGKITQQEFQQAVKDGSFTVEESGGKIAVGYDTLSRTVKEKTDEAANSNDDLAKSTTETKDSTTQALAESEKSWEGLATTIQESVAKASGFIDEYIQKLNTIPPTVTTALVTTDGTGTGGESVLVS